MQLLKEDSTAGKGLTVLVPLFLLGMLWLRMRYAAISVLYVLLMTASSICSFSNPRFVITWVTWEFKLSQGGSLYGLGSFSCHMFIHESFINTSRAAWSQGLNIKNFLKICIQRR